MAIRTDCAPCNSVQYGRQAGVKILEMQCGEIKTPCINFCEKSCDGWVTHAQVDCPEPIVHAGGSLGAEITEIDGALVSVQINAESAAPGEVYDIHIAADMPGCDRFIERFRVKIKGGC